METNYITYIGIIIAFGLLLLATNIIWYAWNTREINECNGLILALENNYKYTCPAMFIPMRNFTFALPP